MKRVRCQGVTRSGEGGFSLVEVTVAVMMLAVGVVAASGLVSVAARDQVRASTRSEMSGLAASKLEQMRALAEADVADTVQLTPGGSLDTSEPNHWEAVQGPSGRDFTLRWRVELGPGGLRRITLRVAPARATPVAAGVQDFATQVLLR